MCLNTWYLFEYVGIPIVVANHHYKYLQDYRRQFSTILDKSIYIDSASDLLNSPLPFHPFTMLTQGVSFLASNAQKQHCLSGEGDAYRYCLSEWGRRCLQILFEWGRRCLQILFEWGRRCLQILFEQGRRCLQICCPRLSEFFKILLFLFVMLFKGLIVISLWICAGE